MQKLPKMPYGQGSFTYEGEKIRYQKPFKSETDGKTYRLLVRGKTVQECFDLMKKKEREKEAEISEKYYESSDSDHAMLTVAMLDWLKLAKQNARKATSFDREERTINNQIAPFKIGRMRIVDISSRDIMRHLNDLQFNVAKKDGKKGYSYSTVKKTYEVLAQFFRYFYASDMNKNPMNRVTPPKSKESIGEIDIKDIVAYRMEDVVLNDDEIETFRDFVFQDPVNGSIGRTKHGVSLYFIMMTCLRAGEAISLTWGDVDMENKTLTVNKTTSRVTDRSAASNKTKRVITAPKTGSGIRTVMLNKFAISALELIKERSIHTEPTDFIICTDVGKSVTSEYLYNKLKTVLKGSGLMTDARQEAFGLHYLRHTGISYYLRHGIPVELVSKMAGHSSINITMNTYYHIIQDQNAKMLEMMNQI